MRGRDEMEGGGGERGARVKGGWMRFACKTEEEREEEEEEEGG